MRIYSLLLPLVLAALPVAAQYVTLTEWEVPWEDSRPRDPYVAPDGGVWFAGQKAGYVGRLDPATGAFTKFDTGPGTGAHNVVVDGQGMVWYAGNLTSHIGRLDPATGDITKVPMPDPAARDPHTLVFDSKGDIWFTVQGGNRIGKLDADSLSVKLIEVPTSRARPYGIQIDANDRPWVVEFGSNKLATVDPATMLLEEIELPRPDARPRRLEITTDQKIWYVDYAGGKLGRYDPESGAFKEWPLPGGEGSRPYATALDHDDRIWIVETAPDPNRLVGFDPASEEFFSVDEIESGGGTVRHMVYDAASNALWFGTDTNTIGRAVLIDGVQR